MATYLRDMRRPRTWWPFAIFLLAYAGILLLLPVAWIRSQDDWRACDAHWAGTSPASVVCMEARRDSRWGPWNALGSTANITNDD